MQNQKKQVAKLQKDDRLLQRPLEYLKSDYDSLWYQTPEIVIEGLIAIIDSEKKLLIAIKQQVIDKKNNSWRRGKFM
jgi:Cu2+-containing amine oxidase